MSEARIRRGIRDLLRDLGFAVYDMEQNRPTRQTPGVSDLIAFGRGVTIFAEIKGPRGRQTYHQSEFEDAVRAGEGHYTLWRSTEEAWNWLLDHGLVRGQRAE